LYVTAREKYTKNRQFQPACGYKLSNKSYSGLPQSFSKENLNKIFKFILCTTMTEGPNGLLALQHPHLIADIWNKTPLMIL